MDTEEEDDIDQIIADLSRQRRGKIARQAIRERSPIAKHTRSKREKEPVLLAPLWQAVGNQRPTHVKVPYSLIELEQWKTTVKKHKEDPGKVATFVEQCLYTNAHGMGSKPEELEICVQSQGFDLIVITETWWNSSHDWNVDMKGYTLFRRDRSGRCSGEVALSARLHLECMELCLGVDDKQVESLWVRIKRQTSKGDTVVGVCYRLPEQEEEVDEAFYRQLEAASQFQALVLVGDLNYPDICWRSNTAKRKHSRRFLESIDDNFLSQIVEDPIRNGVLLDLKQTGKALLEM
ncbi:hypothetical protein HGM15179_017974 [Zosterops borbonicus]|uniref:Mitochondrial fission process protein 1 n=1 Tax=Zosterops borbonicus TaxID=364589 RepID=A0A8K1FZW5_9PASS|nr:hypothetical protein HGM15179_017974 [Zosterops borbonicus]